MFADDPTEAPDDLAPEPAGPTEETSEGVPDGATLCDREPTAEDDALPELTEPLPSVEVPAPLGVGDSVADDRGRVYCVTELVSTQAGLHRYRCTDGKGTPEGLLLEAFREEERENLRRQREILGKVSNRLFPQCLGFLDREDRTYLIVEEPHGPTLAQALDQGALRFRQLLGIIAQVAAGLADLHAQGWVHLALRPSQIILDRPVKLAEVSYATRLGEKSSSAFNFAGYSAPEILLDAPVDVRADVYSVGALLYHGVNRSPIAETGPALGTWEPPKPIAGVPQILHRCLGAPDTRFADMHELHRAVLSLARRQFPCAAYTVGAATSLGLEPSRTVNQDAYVFLTGQLRCEDEMSSWAVLGVADGMGGMAAGEAASQAAVNALRKQALSTLLEHQGPLDDDQTAMVKAWVTEANDRVCDVLAARDARGGTTLTCAWLVDHELAVAHVGDCRLYRISDDDIELLTRDHSVAMARVLQGEISLDDVRTSPDRSRVTRSLGDRQPLAEWYVDTLEPATASPTMTLADGDVLLFASDGLWEPVLESEMLETVQQSQNLRAAAQALLRLALERGGPDNATALLVRLDDVPAPE